MTGYDNAIRHALRTLKNPTAIPVDVSQMPSGEIRLLVDRNSFLRLPKMRALAFESYLQDLCNIIEYHGKVRCSVEMWGE